MIHGLTVLWFFYYAADRSRVILKQGYPDYINACFVNVCGLYC